MIVCESGPWLLTVERDRRTRVRTTGNL